MRYHLRKNRKPMRNSVVIVLMTAVMVGCKPSVPSEYIQPGELEDILYDYHVSQAMAREAGHDNYNYEYKRNAYFKAVLKKYDVTEAVFDSSLVYYYSHAERLKTIYLHVAERLNDDAKVLGAPTGFTITVREVRLSAGAGFIVPLTGAVMTMPGLPKVPAAVKMESEK